MHPPNSAGRPRGQERLQAVQWVTDLLRLELLRGGARDPIPSEDSLIKRFGVSRGVIREVLQLLTEQGLIERVRGAGTFVLAPGPILHPVDESRDLAQDVNAAVPRVAIRCRSVSLHTRTDFAAAKLGMPTGSPVVIMESLTTLDGFPVSVRTAFLPADRFGILVDGTAIDLHRSPYELISEVIGDPVGDTDLEISCSSADALTAELLRVPVGSALLDTSRVLRALDGKPLEFSISHARADHLVFTHVMKSTAAPAEAPSASGATAQLGDPAI